MTKLDKIRLSRTPLDTVTIRLGRTVNLGEYESYRIDVETSSAVMPGETRQEALARITQEVNADLNSKVKFIKKKLLSAEA